MVGLMDYPTSDMAAPAAGRHPAEGGSWPIKKSPPLPAFAKGTSPVMGDCVALWGIGLVAGLALGGEGLILVVWIGALLQGSLFVGLGQTLRMLGRMERRLAPAVPPAPDLRSAGAGGAAF